MDKKKISAKGIVQVIIVIWIILMLLLIGYVRVVGHASGGEFIIALLLWLDVTNRLCDRYWK